MAVQLALSLDATPPGTYRQRGTSSLQRLFRAHFPELVARYESEFATQLGKFRLERISKAVQRFLACGDYPLSGSGVFSRRESCRGIARIKCTNPDCGSEYFRPFSCSVFHSLVGPPHRLCPSCSQKRTLLLGEYMNERLLLRLPHRQAVQWPAPGFVFTLPKVLRVFFRHDKKLHGEISRLIYALVRDFVAEAAGRPLRTAGILVFQTAGAFCRFHPHWHGLFLEGGFEHENRFVHVPLGSSRAKPCGSPTVSLQKMSCCFRQRVIAFFLERKLLNERLAKDMLDWTHSGFSVDASIRIPWPTAGRSPARGPATSTRTREALAQYVVRAPVSLRNLLVDEGGTDTVIYRAPYSDFFKTDTKVFPAVRFLAEVLQHLPDSRCRLIRTYGLYSSRARGTPCPAAARQRCGRVVQSAPPGSPRSRGVEARPSTPAISPHRSTRGAAARAVGVSQAESRRVGETHQEGLRRGPPRRQQAPACESPLICSRCHSPMKIIAVIIDPAQVLKILMHLVKTERPPPGLDPTCLL